MAEKKPEELKLITMEEIQAEKVEWLLYPFIPYGKVTIIQGDPGEGKTTMVLQLIARLTRGEAIFSEEETVNQAESERTPIGRSVSDGGGWSGRYH